MILNLPAAGGSAPQSPASHTCVAGQRVARNGRDAGRTRGDLGPRGLPGCGWSPLGTALEPFLCEIQEEPQLPHRESWSWGSPVTSDLEARGLGLGPPGRCTHLPSWWKGDAGSGVIGRLKQGPTWGTSEKVAARRWAPRLPGLVIFFPYSVVKNCKYLSKNVVVNTWAPAFTSWAALCHTLSPVPHPASCPGAVCWWGGLALANCRHGCSPRTV